MARPLYRDLFTWLTSVPSSIVLVLCLFMPQFRDCNGRIETPLDNHSGAMMIGLAVLGLVPLLWWLRPVRKPAFYVVAIGAGCVMMLSVFGIGAALVIAAQRRLRTDEEIVALCCFTLVLTFVLVFPIFMIGKTALDGAHWTWGAAVAQLAAMISWCLAAATRQRDSLGQASSLS